MILDFSSEFSYNFDLQAELSFELRLLEASRNVCILHNLLGLAGLSMPAVRSKLIGTPSVHAA